MKDLEISWRDKFDRLAVPDLSDWQRACWWDKDTLRYHLRFVLKELKKYSPEGRLLIADTGCGAGIYCLTLSKLGHRVIGLDFAQNALSLARQRGDPGDVTLCAGDANALPFKRNAFDAVLSIGLLQTANDPWRLLDQLDAALRPGGLMLISTLSQHNIWELPWWPAYCLLYCDGFPSEDAFAHKLVRERREMPPRPADEPELILRRFRPGEIRDRLAGMGYNDISTEHNSRFARIPLLYNSFMVNIKAVKAL